MTQASKVEESGPIGAVGQACSRYTASPAMAWEEVKPGVYAKLLYHDETRRERTLLVRLQPDARSAPHSHEEFEQIYVIDGSFEDGERTLITGDFCCRSPGQVHTAYSPSGALVLVTYTGV